MKKTFSSITAVFFILLFGANLALAQGGSSGSSGLTVAQPSIVPSGSLNSKGQSTTNDNGSTTTAGGVPVMTLTLPGATMSTTDAGSALQNSVLPWVTTLIVTIAGGLALLFMIVGGIQMLTAYGNEEKLGEAKKTITWALVGLVISILSYAIVQVIISIRLI